MEQKLKLGGVFSFEHVRDGKVIDKWEQDNIVVDEGLSYTLGVAFDGATSALANWYIGLFKGNYTPVNTDTGANIAANSTESTTEYSEAGRVAWVEAGVSANAIGNAASVAVFTFTAPSTPIYGALLISDSTKGGTAGTLAAASRFSALRTMLASDKLNVTYTLTASSS